MLKYVVLVSVLVFAAPAMVLADDSQPRSFNDLIANDPPANSFHRGPPSTPPGLGGSFPPGCNVLASDKDDRNGPNGDDKNPNHGNPNCQPLSR